MPANPYRPPAEPSSISTEPAQRRFPMAMAGLCLGLLCGSVGAFLGGAFSGCIYRLSHSVTYGGGGVFGLFERLATPWDFAMFHGAVAVPPLALWGSILGLLQASRAARVRLGLGGVVLFGVGGLLVGLANGAAATGGPGNVLPHVMEGPLAGAILGCLAAVAAWAVFRQQINHLAGQSTERQVTFVLSILLVNCGALLLLLASIPLFDLGDDGLQIVAQFVAIALLIAFLALGRLVWRRRVAEADQ